jgi:hypothetical protein
MKQKPMDLDTYLKQGIQLFGRDELSKHLAEFNDNFVDLDENVLTIISNAGVHHLAESHQRGEVYEASNGSLDFSSEESVLFEFERILCRLGWKLRERVWQKIYLVPFGPAALSMQIKVLVHKITDLQTIDVMHLGNNRYVDIAIDAREIAVRTAKHTQQQKRSAKISKTTPESVVSHL